MIVRTRVLIVDDQLRARQSLKALLATCPQLHVVAEAATGGEALAAVPDARPDLVLMDAHMPGMDGIEATRLIKTRWPHVRVIMLSMYSDFAADALGAGADAFISKGAPPDQLLDMVNDVVRQHNHM